MPAGVPAKHRPQPRTRRRFYTTWPADTKPSTPRSPNSRETSVVSAPGRTRRCWPPTVWALTQPRCCWSPPATTPGEWPRNGPSRRCAVPALFRHHRDRPGGIVSTGAVTATPTARCGRCATTRMRTDAATKEYVTRRQGGSKEPKRDHPLPQAAHRPRNLPATHQPATNPQLRPPTQPAPTRRYHHHPSRPSPPNPHRPHLRTRTRPPPQPPARYPIPQLAPNPPTRPITDLTTVGASLERG